jgi:hypothetical protein
MTEGAMLPLYPPALPDKGREPPPQLAHRQPTWRLVVGGAALPYAVLAAGWGLAATTAGGDDAGWETAGRWVYWALLSALGVAVWCCWPLLRMATNPWRLALAAIAVAAYLVGLFVFNLIVYLGAGGPFP